MQLRKDNPVLFADLSERTGKLVAWCIIGASFYLLPLVFLTIKDLSFSSGSISPWLPEGTEQRAIFDEFAERFKAHDSILVSWEGASSEDPLFETLTEKIMTADQVRDFQTGDGLLIERLVSLRTFIDSFGEPYNSDPEFRRELSRRTAGYLTSKGGATGLLLVECTQNGAENREKTFALVDNIVRATIPQGIEPRYEGPCFVDICASRESQRILQKITPVASLVSLVVAWFFLRNALLALLAFVISGLAGILTIASIHFSGFALANMISMVPAIAQLLSMSNVIHLINYYIEALHKHGDKQLAWRHAVSNGWLPTVAASTTTMIGFASLFTSNIGVVRNFAQFGLIAVLISMVIVLTLTTAALILLTPDVPRRIAIRELFLGWLRRITIRRKWLITVTLLAVFFFAGFGLKKLKSDVRMDSFFGEGSSYQVNHSWYKSKTGPVTGSELLFTFHGTVDLNLQFDLLEKTAAKITALNPEYSVLSPSMFRDLMGQSSIDRVWKKVQDSELGVYDEGRYYWRMSIKHPQEPDPGDSIFDLQMDQMIESITTDPDVPERSRPQVQLTGAFQLFANSQDGLVNQLLRSFLCALLLITPVIMIFLRSISLGLIAMIGNLFPLVVFFGFLGWLEFRIDISTMTIAAIAFGIAVDDTVHFLTWLARGLRKYSKDLSQAINYAFENCAMAILQTTMIISLGMTVFFASDFEPSLRFGIFSGLVLIIALIGDLILLPAMILGVFRRVFSTKKTCQPAEIAVDSTS